MSEAIVLEQSLRLVHGRIEIDPTLVEAMKKIARGRTNGHPLKAEDGRQVMRTAMASCGMDW